MIYMNAFRGRCFKNDPGVHSVSYPSGTFDSASGKGSDSESDNYLCFVPWLGLFGIDLYGSFVYLKSVIHHWRFYLKE